MIKIPENEFNIDFVCSSGPGGQNVNRRKTKAQLRWNINDSKILTGEQKEQVRKRLSFTKEGDLILEGEETRHQTRNKEIVIQRLNEFINQALKKKKKRKKTKPSKASIERRLEEKKRQSEKKKSRQKYFL